jgi:hypothetical protein
MLTNVNPEDLVGKALENVEISHSVELRAASTRKDDSQHDTLHVIQ